MEKLVGACLVAQSGGPTAVINASAYGVFKTAFENSCITRVLAAQHGIRGVLNDDILDIDKEDKKNLELMMVTPASVIGSCRYKLAPYEEDGTDYRRILEIFKKYDIRYFFYNGGNDSMDTCNKISKFFQQNDYECRIMGIPKTIDNDLMCTDHAPGYGSAAKYIALSTAEITRDVMVYDKDAIVIIEAMGRHAGWLAGAACAAGISGKPPAMIYLPEVDFDLEKFFEDIDEYRKTHQRIIIVVSEGIHDKDGKFISEYGINDTNVKDSFGHVQLGGLASTLAHLVRERTGAKVRGIELSLLQRCAGHAVSKIDRDEAFLAGKTAVEAAISGKTDKMVAFERNDTYGYKCKPVLVDLSDVANTEKCVPRDWINEEGNNVNEKFIQYVIPLIQGDVEKIWENGMPKYVHLERIKAQP